MGGGGYSVQENTIMVQGEECKTQAYIGNSEILDVKIKFVKATLDPDFIVFLHFIEKTKKIIEGYFTGQCPNLGLGLHFQ